MSQIQFERSKRLFLFSFADLHCCIEFLFEIIITKSGFQNRASLGAMKNNEQFIIHHIFFNLSNKCQPCLLNWFYINRNIAVESTFSRVAPTLGFT